MQIGRYCMATRSYTAIWSSRRRNDSLFKHIYHLSGRLSYQALADRMNADNIPFSQESPLWNKHKIKRMLENSRLPGKWIPTHY